MPLATTYLATGSGLVFIWIVVVVIVAVLEIAGMWKAYEKAHEHGWAVIIPIYHFWCLLRIVGRPKWWLILYFIPFANIVVLLIALWDLAKSFGKSAGWFFGLWLLPFIFWPMLGFGEAVYAGPAGPEPWAATA